jgi:hypothetical protein
MFPKPDLFPSSGTVDEWVPTQLGLLERSSLNHWTAVYEAMCFKNAIR